MTFRTIVDGRSVHKPNHKYPSCRRAGSTGRHPRDYRQSLLPQDCRPKQKFGLSKARSHNVARRTRSGKMTSSVAKKAFWKSISSLATHPAHSLIHQVAPQEGDLTQACPCYRAQNIKEMLTYSSSKGIAQTLTIAYAIHRRKLIAEFPTPKLAGSTTGLW